jgi:hypothetical protein
MRPGGQQNNLSASYKGMVGRILASSQENYLSSTRYPGLAKQTDGNYSNYRTDRQ